MGSAAVTAVFVATTFAVPDVVDQFAVGPGTAALISTVQVGGFTLTNLLGGRRLLPTRSMAQKALLVMATVNIASAVAPDFASLVVLRFISGLAMGLFTWIAWSDSASDGIRRGEIAAIGPLTAAVAAPALGLGSQAFGLAGLYWLLAALSGVCLLAPITVEASISKGRRPIQARGVIPVLFGMSALTLGGSAVFVFLGVIARENVGMSTLGLSLALSLNAVVGIPTARYAGRRRFPGVFVMIIGMCAVLLTITSSSFALYVILVVWGMSFWAAIPEAFALISERSVHAADRIGDAQAVMAVGRVVGPTIGGVLVATGSYAVLGIVAGAIIVVGGVVIELVSRASPVTV
jgi:predicted MFS family arabinose efflux permease